MGATSWTEQTQTESGWTHGTPGIGAQVIVLLDVPIVQSVFADSPASWSEHSQSASSWTEHSQTATTFTEIEG